MKTSSRPASEHLIGTAGESRRPGRQVANAVQVDTARAILEAVVRAHGA